ncbi:chitin synthase chs-2-like isoform X2 [Mytilus californianus]|uniref:chitin synthase chs-2-like isoform X2 n=1 Tax=Mytilus californianus TaxID=6549 RepID=UPI002247E1BC|nr:chitin synthase chs-2-like isoform X2 [Mytilus californianus]
MAAHDNKGFSQDDEDKITSSTNETGEPNQDQQTIDWDIFQENRSAAKYVKSDEFWKTSEKILTVIFVGFLFLVVSGTALLSRVTIHILVWHIKPPELPRNNDTNATFQTKQSLYHVVDETWIWALFITIVAPYGFTMCSSLKTMCLKKTRVLHFKSVFVILFFESLHSIGLVCFVYIVLPTFNAPAASIVYMSKLVLLPLIELVSTCTRNGPDNGERKGDTCRYFVTVFGVLLQIGGIALICVYMSWNNLNVDNTVLVIIFVVSAIFISLTYWENFVKSSADKSNWLSHLKWIYQTRRTKILCIVSFWKIIISFITILVLYAIQAENALDGIKAIFNSDESRLKYDFGGHFLGKTDICKAYIPYVVAAVNICSSYICAKAAKTACVTGCQILCFSIPLILTPVLTPFALQGLVSYPDILDFKDCDMFFSRWNLESMENISDSWPLVAGGLLLYISILFISSYIWTTNGFILGKTQRMFILPMYCGIHTDLSLLLNRSQKDKEFDFIREMERNKRFEKEKKRPNQKHDKCNKPEERSKIYACATMWHETEIEMTQLLKSIFRMDKHHHMIKTARQSNVDKDNLLDYDFEAHIFFDDAFESPRIDQDFPDVNDYVKILIKVMDTAASAVHRTVIQLEEYEMIRTPYGGRLTWKLLGGNSLVCHLKDKTKIRHKKRWSQVMYMYYFLSYRLPNKIDRIVDNSYNTFLLALDGDVDFQPEAVMHLVRRMRKNPMVGAACGRIHPIGHGPLVWYQKFEYAVSHWLQKATEHVIGCVLCSPGCFSLFRGSAVMDVLKTYTTEPSEARHFIQYDQGEDRWLCTLLLKQGHRVEYCAESDALTYAPEGFNEFYNQRRRWTPSTMANILDLLTDCRATVTQNQSISTLYMAYQLFLFISSLLTPGTIFLMIVGAIIVGFPSVPPWLSLILNLIPVGLFMLSCIFTKSETQLLFAGILSAIYSIVMLLVLVGITKEAAEEELCSVTTVFLCFVAGVFIISAFLHPKEFSCIMHGILYFVSIPSMSMLLLLYSLGNLHVVSWGTREVKQPVVQKNKTENQMKDTESGYTLSLGKIFRCIWCPMGGIHKQDIMYQTILDRIKSLEHELKRTSDGEHKLQSIDDKDENTTNLEETKVSVTDVRITIHNDKIQEETQTKTVNFETAKPLTKEEETFWEQLIEKYLKPLEKNDVKEKMIKEELIALRNKCCLFFFLINAFLVTLIYALTQTTAYSDTLSIKIECMSIEPISVTFTIVFGILLCIQFICMLYHRISTLIHITATTSIKEKPDEIANLLLAIQVLQRSGSVDSRISARTEDYQYVFEENKKKEIQCMIEKVRNKRVRQRLLDLDQVVREAIPINDVIEGQNNKIEQDNAILRQFGQLTGKEREAMRKFINGKQKKVLKNKLDKEVILNENTTQL